MTDTCRECGGAVNCQHCHPAQLPRDRERIEYLEAALRAIYDASDGARDEQDWGDRVSAAMTDERRALVTKS